MIFPRRAAGAATSILILLALQLGNSLPFENSLHASDALPEMELLGTFENPTGQAPQFSPSGKTLIIRTAVLGKIRLIDVDSGDTTDIDLKRNPSCITIGPDDSFLYAGFNGKPKKIAAYSCASGEIVWESEMPTEGIGQRLYPYELKVSPNGETLSAAGPPGLILSFDASTGEFVGHEDGIRSSFMNGVSSITYLRGGTHLIGNERDPLSGQEKPCVFEIATGEKVVAFAMPSVSIPDLRHLTLAGPSLWRPIQDRPYVIGRVTASSNRGSAKSSALALWNIDTGECERVLYQGSFDLARATDLRIDPSNRYAYFAAVSGEIHVAPLSGSGKAMAFPFPGVPLTVPVPQNSANTVYQVLPRLSIAADGQRVSVEPARLNDQSKPSTSNPPFKVFGVPDLRDPVKMDSVQKTLAELKKDANQIANPAAELGVATSVDKQDADTNADAGAIKNRSDAGAIQASVLPENGIPKAEGSIANSKPRLLDAWQVDLAPMPNSPPFTAVGRIVGDSFLMCFSTKIPWLTVNDGRPRWTIPQAKLKSRFATNEIKVYRGNGKEVPDDQAKALLAEERFVFAVPTGLTDIRWGKHLQAESVVVGINLDPANAPGCNPVGSGATIDAVRQLPGVCESSHLIPHAPLELRHLQDERPNLRSEQLITVTKYRMETKTRTITVEVQTETGVETRQREATYTVCVPFSEMVSYGRFSDQPPSRLASSSGTIVSEGDTPHQLRCYRANGSRIHPLVFLGYAKRTGSFLELDANEKIQPTMWQKNLSPWASVVQFIPLKQPPPQLDEGQMRDKLKTFRQHLAANEIDEARNVLFVLPITKPLWANEFYELAFHQHREGKAKEAFETVLAGAMLEWEKEIPNWNAGWISKHQDASATWLVSTRSKLRSALDSPPTSGPVAFAPEPPKLGQPGTYTFDLAERGSTENETRKEFAFRFSDPSKFTAHLKHKGSDNVMMLFMGNDAKRNHWIRKDAKKGENLSIEIDITEADIRQVGIDVWKLDIANWGTDPAKCEVVVEIIEQPAPAVPPPPVLAVPPAPVPVPDDVPPFPRPSAK